jgi:hypothetical protein
LLALTFAGGWLGLRRRASEARNGRGGRRRGASKDAVRILTDMEAAARNRDAASFFTHARTALEVVQRSAPEARTELSAGRTEAGWLEAAHGGENDEMRRFFALADEVNYAGLQPTPEEFERWMEFMRDAFHRGTLQRGTLERGALASGKSS